MSGLPEGVANGPNRSEHSDTNVQLWERPWTLEEMRQNSANWSLAADSGLFLYLQDFSQKMLSKTHDIEKQLDSLIRDTKATDSCLHSVFNDFLMLSNTQFIENRVYDEEVEETIPKADTLEKQPEQEKTREQKEAELIPKMQEAVSYGLKVLESAFEQLDIKAGNSDSEDEEVADRVEAILEPKDLYVDRPLPYLIGSQAFMEQEDVGLGDLSSDEMSVDSDRDSVIGSEDGKDADHSDEDFNQEEGESHSHNNKKKSSMLSYEDDEEEEDEDSDIFGESEGDDEDDNDDTKNTGSSSFADELAARIKGEPLNKPDADRASLASKKKSKSKKEPKPAKPPADDDSDDMFKPPKMEDDDFSPFGGKGGLFSGGRGLFDNDDEGDLFSEAPKPAVPEVKKVLNETVRIPKAQAAESEKPAKKIPSGAISVFPENSLFGSGKDSDPEETKENGTPAAAKHAPLGAGVGGGLFDDEEEDDDFFSGKSLSKSDSVVQDKPTTNKAVDLFDEDDEDGDIFGEKFGAPTPAQNKKEVAEEPVKQPEKKLPAGAISMFGPGTKSLLSEGLKRRQLSTSEESEKSEENGPATVKQTEKAQTRGLFSDDEDTQAFPTPPKSHSKPEPSIQSKGAKAPLSLFDDEEEEDLFASAAKSKPKPNQAKESTSQSSKAVSGSLFSDDEDQWMSSKSSPGQSEANSGGMTSSVSAPSSFQSAKTSHESSLFDEDDDLFAPSKPSSQKKTQRVALLFEDEGDDEDEDKGSLFGIKPAVNTHTVAPGAKSPAVAPQSAVEKKQEPPAAKSTEPPPSPSPENTTESKKKPAGAVSLFGGIDVLPGKQTKSLSGEEDRGGVDSEPPNTKQTEDKNLDKEKTIAAVSLFDEEEEEDESDWNDSIFTPSKPVVKNALKPTEEQQQQQPQQPAKSTGVFQDEELLFSHTQQKDNDPDVDLFATGKPASSKPSLAKPVAHSLFADEDEDDLFSSIKPKAPPPKVAEKPSKPSDKAPLASPESVSEIQKPAPSPVKPKESSSRIGKLQANLMINPAALLPGAVPSRPVSVSLAPDSSSGVSSSSISISPSPVTTPVGLQADTSNGVSFDAPVQTTTLQSANKGRTKGSMKRRPQTRTARQQSALRSVADIGETLDGDVTPGPNPGLSGLGLPPQNGSNQPRVSPTPPDSSTATASSASSLPRPSLAETSHSPPVTSLPVSTKAGKKDSSKESSRVKVLPPADEDDLFGSNSLFGAASVSDTPPPVRQQTPKTAQPQAGSEAGPKRDKDKSTLSSIFDGNTDLFQKVKPRATTKKAKASPFLEEEDDDEDLFGVSSSSTPTSSSSKDIKNSNSFSKHDIFQDEVAAVPKVHKKHKEQTVEASLFDDDNIDIFADLTDSLRPKQKSTTKGETKSIFDDDMDDIFSPSTAKAVTKAPHKVKKTPPSQENSTAADTGDIFDDPLNALGGN